MLNQNVTVVFKHSYGAESLSVRCDWVRYGVEILGEVFEDIDFNLIEDFQNVRVSIRLKVRLDFTNTVWMTSFLASTSKVITVDGQNIEVVNDGKKFDFPLFEDSNVKSYPELRFKVKNPGQLGFAVPGEKLGFLNDYLVGAK